MTFDSEILAISCDPTHSLRAFADSDGLNFPLLSDFWPHGAVDPAVRRLRRGQGSPAAVVIRRRQARQGALGGAQPDLGRAGTSTSTSGSSTRSRMRHPRGGLDRLPEISAKPAPDADMFVRDR